TSLEDERRLFYVAMTRSQKFLYMTWAPIEGKGNRYTRPSEFWEGILESKFVTRRAPGFSNRKRLPSRSKAGITNVVLSFSELKYFFECPYQFKLRILYGFNAPIHEALGYGKSLHDALAELHGLAIDKKKISPAVVPGLVDTHLHLPYAYPTLKEKLEESARQILTDYIQQNRKLFDKIEFSEKKIELNLGEGVSVSGRIDLVRRLDTGEISIVDLKTSERSQAEAVTETQLHIYAMGYEQLTGRRADYVEIYELEEGRRKPRSVDASLIGDVTKNVLRAANALRSGDLPPTPARKTCRSCDYLRMCSAGQERVSPGAAS
ncbi:MAG TPA: PD-(D/E)XK nuclease family protein, partial [Archangium sp.]